MPTRLLCVQKFVGLVNIYAEFPEWVYKHFTLMYLDHLSQTFVYLDSTDCLSTLTTLCGLFLIKFSEIFVLLFCTAKMLYLRASLFTKIICYDNTG